MKFTVNKHKLLFSVVSIVFLLETNFFYLVDFGRFNAWISRSSRALPGVIALCILCTCSLGYKIYHKRFITNYSILFTICITLLFFFSIICYRKQFWGTTAHLMMNYFLFYLTIPLYHCFRNGYIKPFFNFLNAISFIWYIIIIIQSYMLNVSGEIFLINYFANGMSVRNDRVRIMLLPFTALVLAMNFAELVNKEKLIFNNKVFSFVQVLLGTYCIVVIQQSRLTIIIFIVLFGAIYYINSEGGIHALMRVTILGMIGWKICNSPVFIKLISSFSLKGDAGISTYARIQAVQYYLSCFINNPLFGIGFPDDRIYPYVAHGSNGLCYVSDVGIVGMIGEMGILGIILFVVLTFRLIKILKRAYKQDYYLKNILVTVFLFYLFNLFSWYVFLPACISMLPIILALFEYCNNEINNQLLWKMKRKNMFL